MDRYNKTMVGAILDAEGDKDVISLIVDQIYEDGYEDGINEG